MDHDVWILYFDIHTCGVVQSIFDVNWRFTSYVNAQVVRSTHYRVQITGINMSYVKLISYRESMIEYDTLSRMNPESYTVLRTHSHSQSRTQQSTNGKMAERSKAPG